MSSSIYVNRRWSRCLSANLEESGSNTRRIEILFPVLKYPWRRPAGIEKIYSTEGNNRGLDILFRNWPRYFLHLQDLQANACIYVKCQKAPSGPSLSKSAPESSAAVHKELQLAVRCSVQASHGYGTNVDSQGIPVKIATRQPQDSNQKRS